MGRPLGLEQVEPDSKPATEHKLQALWPRDLADLDGNDGELLVGREAQLPGDPLRLERLRARAQDQRPGLRERLGQIGGQRASGPERLRVEPYRLPERLERLPEGLDPRLVHRRMAEKDLVSARRRLGGHRAGRFARPHSDGQCGSLRRALPGFRSVLRYLSGRRKTEILGRSPGARGSFEGSCGSSELTSYDALRWRRPYDPPPKEARGERAHARGGAPRHRASEPPPARRGAAPTSRWKRPILTKRSSSRPGKR